MEAAHCPHCNEPTISGKQRWVASKWKDIYCSDCGGRIAINPILLAIMYFVLVWDIFFFGFMALYEKSIIYFTVMLVGWAILEFFELYLPLVRLRPKQTQSST